MKAVKEIVNLILIIPLLMVLSTVFAVSTDLANGIVSGKYFLFYLSIGLVAVSAIISIYLNCKSIQFSLIDLLIILFCGIGFIVSYYFNEEVTNKMVLLILITILYFYFKIFIVQYKWTAFILITFFIITGLVEAIWGLRQLYGFSLSQHHIFKTTGSFFNSGPYAGYLVMILPIAFYYLLSDYRIFSRKPKSKQIPFCVRWSISLATSISILLVLPSTMSRASWIAAIGGCLAVGVFYLLKQKNKYIKNYMTIRY